MDGSMSPAAQAAIWIRAVGTIDATELPMRDLIERELAPLKPAGRVRLGEVNAITVRLMQQITELRTAATKQAFRELRDTLGDKPVLDHSLAAWASTILRLDLAGIDTAIRTGLIAGLDNAAVAHKVVGSMDMNGVDGVTEVTRSKIAHLGRVSIKRSPPRGATA